jgi:hypothetical protein
MKLMIEQIMQKGDYLIFNWGGTDYVLYVVKVYPTHITYKGKRFPQDNWSVSFFGEMNIEAGLKEWKPLVAKDLKSVNKILKVKSYGSINESDFMQ